MGEGQPGESEENEGESEENKQKSPRCRSRSLRQSLNIMNFGSRGCDPFIRKCSAVSDTDFVRVAIISSTIPKIEFLKLEFFAIPE
jgi:hypothetical protein